MYARTFEGRGRRRGIVLVLILGMLGLMALIGVTFATFAGQAQVNSRNFRLGLDRPSAESLMDYALAQLVNDTNNPNSALRGHSLLRDMYGNDSRLGGAARFDAYLDALPGSGVPLQFQEWQFYPDQSAYPVGAGGNPYLAYDATRAGPPDRNFIQVRTNIPVGQGAPELFGVDFTRWILRLQPIALATGGSLTAQTFEVLEDDATGNIPRVSGGGDFAYDPNSEQFMHVFTLSANDLNTGIFFQYFYPNNGANNGQPPLTPAASQDATPQAQGLVQVPFDFSSEFFPATYRFTLDGRYLNAFNGPGINQLSWTYVDPVTGNRTDIPAGQFPNFRLNGNLLSGNGSLDLTVPSVGNPDFVGMDEDYDACDLENWFLAIQSADGKVMVPSFHRPGIIRGNPSAPLDPMTNDWRSPLPVSAARFLRPRQVDHPSSGLRDLTPDPITGEITFDVDNDGDGVTDSVWLDLGYPPRRDAGGRMYKPLFAFMVLGLNGRMPLNTAGNLQYRHMPNFTTTAGGVLPPNLPLYDHASNLGYSPSEINPKYALQNFPGPTNDVTDPTFSQVDNVGVPVWRTQLRNLLAGTRAQTDPRIPDPTSINGETNFVAVAGQPFFMPNGVYDDGDSYNDFSTYGRSIERRTAATAGRWGEADHVPPRLYDGLVSIRPMNVPAVSYSAPGIVADFEDLNWFNPVRAGRSAVSSDPPHTVPLAADNVDDNFTALDFFPTINTGNHPELYNFYDRSGQIGLPSERFRRFVSPFDIAGIGKVLRFNTVADPLDPFGYGPDRFGRVSHFRHFRPAGSPGSPATPQHVTTNDPNTGLPMNTAAQVAGNWVNPPSKLALPLPTSPPYTDEARRPRANRLHGYDGYRLPKGNQAQVSGGMPLDVPQPPTGTPGPGGLEAPTYIVRYTAAADREGNDEFKVYPRVHTSPTFGELVFPAAGTVHAAYGTYNALPMGNPGIDEADEMDLYAPNSFDSRFGPADLEWLYRRQDVDGTSLTSRLAKLAPVSFLNPIDGLTRRRMFSIDSWDLINYAWSHDNPVNGLDSNTNRDAAGNPILMQSPAFDANSLNQVAAIPAKPFRPAAFNPALGNASHETFGVVAGQRAGSVYDFVAQKPSLGHRDHRINLNYPLPVSNNPSEPVRLKWVREAYELMKTVLPPRAVDTPEELAELSQFLVNVIDFRDGDATSTQFVNPDVVIEQGDATHPPRPVPAGAVVARPTVPLVQFGMEYQPVAINEVLAYQFTHKDPNTGRQAANPTPRLYIEVVNTLQDSESTGINNNNNLNLQGWRWLILPDDPTGRPDPVTGQPPTVAGTTTVAHPNAVPVAITGEGTAPTALGNAIPALTSGQSTADMTRVEDATTVPPTPAPPAADAPGRYYYVFGNRPPADVTTPNTDYEDGQEPPHNTGGGGNAIDQELPFTPGTLTGTPRLVNQLLANAGTTPAVLTSGQKQFKWLYLMRPSNPFDDASPLVAVDAMRFPFAEGGGTVVEGSGTTRDVVTRGNVTIYSVQRLQPYRGGHLVNPYDDGSRTAAGSGIGGAPAPRATPPTPADPYGFTEQTAPVQNAGNGRTFRGVYRTSQPPGNDSNANDPNYTVDITHTIGARNNPNDDVWDYFPFLDRDFQSVAELMLVPGCPPGLFTKKFVESMPPHITPINYGPAAAGQMTYFTAANYPADGGINHVPGRDSRFDAGRDFMGNAGAPAVLVPQTYPYLVDKFFYTGASDATHLGDSSTTPPTNPAVGGYTAAGWHKMFEFFEVPSPAMGAIGLAEQGSNFDWFRQDRRPGLLNLNLIVDQEVFLGLLDDPRLNLAVVVNPLMLPQVVTQLGPTGYPISAVPLANRGLFYPNRSDGPGRTGVPGAPGDGLPPYYEGEPIGGMTQAFSDFLKLRSGGSGFLFAHGTGVVGSGPAPSPAFPNPTVDSPPGFYPVVAADRPFRSLSYPDINATVMRPATLPPMGSINNQPAVGTPQPYPQLWNPLQPALASLTGPPALTDYYAMDQGVKNPHLTKAYRVPNMDPPTTPLPSTPFPRVTPAATLSVAEQQVPQPPPIPPRRLFSLPDVAANRSTTAGAGTTKFPNNHHPHYTSPASQGADLPATEAIDNGQPEVNRPILHPNLSNKFGGLFRMQPLGVTNPALPTSAPEYGDPYGAPNPAVNPGGVANPGDPIFEQWNTRYLGANQNAYDYTQADTRAHPAYRIEMLQKVMNLTTVRTHQFAVWITVGFFEVLRPGNSGVTPPQPDLLGPEIGLNGGDKVRYRSFFVLDRTRAAGFNPVTPIDFRKVVVYRRSIE